jgi:hypothetical protein
MANLSHWDFALDFNGFEASALILGIDPQLDSEGFERAKPVFERVERSYAALRAWHEVDITPSDTDKLGHLARPSDGLESVEMYESLKTTVPDHIYVGGPAFFLSWLLDKNGRSKFEKQRFTRSEISRWLNAVGMASVYHFNDSHRNEASPVYEKPLGTTERHALLTIVAVLAKAAKLDIKSPGKTAQFIEGLSDEMGVHVSKRTVEDHLKKIPGALESRMK